MCCLKHQCHRYAMVVTDNGFSNNIHVFPEQVRENSTSINMNVLKFELHFND